MKIGDLATSRVVTIGRQGTALEAARSMREHRVGEVVLVDETPSARVPLGLLTDRDIVGAAAEGADLASLRATEIASRDPLIADADQDIDDVVRAMQKRSVRRALIVNPLGELVGVVAYEDVVAWMAEELAEIARALR